MGFVKGGVIDDGRFHLFPAVRFDFLFADVGLEFILDPLGDFLLFARGTEDGAPILGPTVVALLVERRRVVKTVKEFHHILENLWRRGGFFRQLDVEDFDVARHSAANLSVGRILHPVGIGIHKADLGVGDAPGVFFLKVLDDVFFGSPVTACAECQCRCNWCHIVDVVAFRDW